jgi:hypothetical protein
MVKKDMMILLQTLIICYVLSSLTNFIGELMSMYSTPKNKALGVMYLLLSYMLTCKKCSSFWLALILTGDLFSSSLVAIAMIVIDKIETKYNKTTL